MESIQRTTPDNADTVEVGCQPRRCPVARLGSRLSLGQTFVAIHLTIRRGLNCTITGSGFMGRFTEKLILFVQIILVAIGVLSLVLGAFALIGKWLSQGS